ncbi:MAG TPA: VCBS repeat-containing protein, partial [Gammaproteobacteria bacterium]|nr:VCBS repeat-containing protein [Gammaproteobacteria bacterium]
MVAKNTAVKTVLGMFFSLAHISGLYAAGVSYAPPVSTAAGVAPEYVAKGELNGDTNEDVVCVNADNSGTVSVLLSDGTGGFTKVNYPVGVQPRTVSIGDLDGDGDNDLVVTNTDTPGTGSVTILLNNGSGAFTEAAGSPIDIEAMAGTDAEPSAAVIAQLNSTTDSNADIAIGNDVTNNVQILLGDGTGGFTKGNTIAVGTKPIAIDAGSLNSGTDSLTDLVVANLNDGTINVLLGDGLGGFTNASGSPMSVGAKPFAVRVASIDNGTDAIPDIALVNHSNGTASTVRTLKGAGDGTFTAMFKSGELAGRPHSVDIVDLDSDGLMDLVVANDKTGTAPVPAVTTLLGDGAGNFATVAEYPVSGAPNSVVSLDLDGINQLDLVVANGDTDSVDVLLSVPTANAPVASADVLSVIEDTAANGTLNGSDADGALLRYAVSTAPGKGSVSITDRATGTYIYTPNADATGSDSFAFTVDDGTGASTPATITVTIGAVNDQPVRTAGTLNDLTVLEDASTTSLGLGTLAYGPGGGTDEAGQALSYTVTAVPA